MIDGMRRFAFLMMTLAAGACAVADFSPRGLPGRVNAPPPALEIADDSLLNYALWVWQETQFANGTRVVPEAPDRYTVEFQPGGKVNVRADCNRGAGQYVQAGARLSVDSIALTKMACSAGSREAEFVKELNAVAEQSLRGTDLLLTLRDGAGSMRFTTPRP